MDSFFHHPDELQAMIAEGRYRIGEPLPPIKTLCIGIGVVSRTGTRSAIRWPTRFSVISPLREPAGDSCVPPH